MKEANDLRSAAPEPDLIEEMAELVKRHEERGCCAEVGCGCPGSRLRSLVEELKQEFLGYEKQGN